MVVDNGETFGLIAQWVLAQLHTFEGSIFLLSHTFESLSTTKTDV